MADMSLSETTIGFGGIRWIAFDAVGTLIYPDPPVAVVYHQAAVQHGSCLTLDEIERRFPAAFRKSEASNLRTGELHAEDLLVTSEEREYRRWQEIVATVIDDARHPEQCLDQLFRHFARPNAWKCYPDVGQTLARLRQFGFRLALASNFDHRLLAIARGQPELAPVEQVVVSSLVGYRKPSPRFYEALASALHASPESILMVGDDEENDVVGARAAGLQAVQLMRGGKAVSGQQLGPLTDLLDLLGK